MTAELLRRAAKVLRDHAEAASPSPWVHVDYSDPQYQPLTSDGRQSTYMGCGSVITDHKDYIGGPICAPDGDLYPRGGYNPKSDMAYVALMHPPVALAVADLLVEVAEHIDAAAPLAEALDIEAHEVLNVSGPTIAVARAILREEAS